MNRELLWESFSHLDENLIERSETAPPSAARRWLAAAACFVLLAAAVAAAPHLVRRPDLRGEGPAPAAAAPAENAAILPEGAPPAGNAAMLPDVGLDAERSMPAPPMIESYKTEAEACYVTPKDGEVNYSVPLREAMEEYGDSTRYRVVVDLFRGESQLPADGAEVRAEIDRLAALGYTVAYERVYEQQELKNAYFTLHASYDELAHFQADDGCGYMLFLYAERVKSSDPNAFIVSGDPDAKVPWKISESGAAVVICPPDSSEALTADEARAEPMGAYLGGAPAGFGEQEFRRSGTTLSASFRRGYDYVEWRARPFTPEDAARVTAAADTENYDLALYPIPRAESVPAALRELVNDPIFRAEELTLETVQRRAEKVSEAGDSDGWRMRFSVLYDGETLVGVSAKGVEPDWVFAQLAALGGA